VEDGIPVGTVAVIRNPDLGDRGGQRDDSGAHERRGTD